MEHRISIVISSNAGQQTGPLRSFAGAASSAGAAVRGAGTAARTGAAGFTGVGAAGRSAGAGLGAASGAAAGAGSNIAATGQSAGLAGRAIQGLGNFARQTASHFTGYVAAAAVIRLVSNAFDFAKDAILGFDSALTQSTAIMGDVSEAVKKSLGDTALGVAMNYNAQVKDVAKGYYYLVSAGYDVESSQRLIGQATAFAKAGMFDLEKATELAADAQTAMGLKSKDAAENQRQFTRVTDVLTEANNRASGTVEQFASALNNKAAASARIYGVSLEETVAVLATFHEQGMKAQKAGTAFDIVLRDLVKGARTHAQDWKALGVTVFDAQGNFVGMANVMEDLQRALTGMSVKEKDATLSTLGLQYRSVNFTKTLIGTSDRIREFEGYLRDAGGATQDVAERQMQSMIEKLQHLRSVAEVAAVRGFQKLAEGAGWLAREFGPAIGNVVDTARKLADVLGPIALGVGKIAGGASVGALKLLATVFTFVTDQAERFHAVIGGLLIMGAVKLATTLAGMLVPAIASLAASMGGPWLLNMAIRFDAATAAARLFVGQTIATGSAAQGAAAASSSLKLALSGLSAVPLLAIATAAFSMYQHIQNTDRAAEDAAKTLAGEWDPNGVNSMGEAIGRLEARSKSLGGDIESYPGRLQMWASGMADLLVPFHDVENSAEDLGAELRANDQQLEAIVQRKEQVKSALLAMAHALTDLDEKAAQAPKNLVSFNAEAQKLARVNAAAEVDKIAGALQRLAQEKGIDPTVAEGRKELERLYQLGRQTAPFEQLYQSFEQTADGAADAETQVKAFKEALDALFGIALTVHDAQTKLATGFKDLADQANESKAAGVSGAQAFDLNSAAAKRNLDAVAANRDGVSQQVQNILALAEAYRAQGKTADEASADMLKQRDALVAQLVAYGMTRAEAERYLATIGLTPENIRTVAELDSEGAQSKLDQMNASLDEVDKGAHALVGLTKEEAAKRAAELQAQLDQIKQGAHALTGVEKEEAARRVADLQRQLDQVKQGAYAVAYVDTTAAEQNLARLGIKLNDLERRVIRGNENYDSGMRPHAEGAIVSYYAAGGVRGAERHIAQVAPAGAWRVWAEPETGGEAYIPLAPSKRVRSKEILDRVANQFGYQLLAKDARAYGAGGGYGLKEAAFELAAHLWATHGGRLYEDLSFEGASKEYLDWLSGDDPQSGMARRRMLVPEYGTPGVDKWDRVWENGQSWWDGSKLSSRMQEILATAAAPKQVSARMPAFPGRPSDVTGYRGGGGGVVIQSGAVQITVRADAAVDSRALEAATRAAVTPAIEGLARRIHVELRARGGR